jgi:hypothetical protein
MLFKEIIHVCSENYKKAVNKTNGKKGELLIFKAGGTYKKLINIVRMFLFLML